MELEKIKSITLSLLKRESDVKDNEATYSKKVTAKFVVPENFHLVEENAPELLEGMYSDLLKNAPDDVDSIGIWIEMDTITLDNALSLQTLDDIKKYSQADLNPAWEFFKMTLQ
jgi:hypothetical protein